MSLEKQTQRDAFLGELHARMRKDKKIFFLSADFGSPKLDSIRKDFPERFVNVGIAEQNLVNVATGLALEGYSVYAFGISTFLAMRAFEQIRIDLALQAQIKKLNVNLVGVGAGVGYDVSGPTHHCLEDLALMRLLPNITVFSPSDWAMAKGFVDYSLQNDSPKYLRFDSKPCLLNYAAETKFDYKKGFIETRRGKDICFIATGYMVKQALTACDDLKNQGVDAGVIDLFTIKPFDEEALLKQLTKYRALITVHEGFLDKGGLDTLVASLCVRGGLFLPTKHFGFKDSYTFVVGGRDYLHAMHKIAVLDLVGAAREIL